MKGTGLGRRQNGSRFEVSITVAIAAENREFEKKVPPSPVHLVGPNQRKGLRPVYDDGAFLWRVIEHPSSFTPAQVSYRK